MFIQFVLNKIYAKEIQDMPYNPFDKKSEFYQTWQLCDLDPLIPLEKEAKSNWARQGFSLGGAPDSGIEFSKGEERRVDDPQITFKLPPLKKGEIRRFRLDIHWWESDLSTEKVRGVFTSSALKLLIKSWKKANEDNAKAKDLLEKWIKENMSDVIKGVLKAASLSGTPWISVACNMLPLFELILDVVRNNTDDYLARHSFILEIQKTEESMRWRTIYPGMQGDEWRTGEGTQKIVRELSDAEQGNVLIATYRCRILE